MKPDKYGLKIWILSDSSTAYVQNAQIYLGKTGNLPEVGLAQRVVHDLSRPLEGSGRNITCDNFFTSIPLAQSLLQKKLTILGTIRSNKRQLPPEFCKDKSREQHSTLFGFSDRMSLCSYVPKKGAVVNLLSTMPPDDQIYPTEKTANRALSLHITKAKVLLTPLIRSCTVTVARAKPEDGQQNFGSI